MEMIRKAIQAFIKENGIEMEKLAERCGWTTSKLKTVIEGYNAISSADYGTICEAVGVDYDHFRFMALGVSEPIL